MARGGGTRIGGIVIDVLGNTLGLQKELKEADRAVAKFAKNFSKEWKNSTAGVTSAATSLVSFKNALVGIAGTAGLGALVKGTLDYADSVGEASDALGLTTKAYQELKFAASQSSIDQEKFTASFSKFVQLGEQASQDPNSGPAAVFTRLGISAKEAGGDVETLFNLVIQQLDAIPTQNERLKIIGELFGKKVAAQWAATFAQGASGLSSMREQAQALGLVLDDASVKGLGKLADQVDAIGQKFKVAFAKGLVEGLTGKTGEFAELLEDPALMTALDGIASGFEKVAEQVGKIPGHLQEIPAALADLEKYRDLLQIFGAFYLGAKGGSFVGGLAAKTPAGKFAFGLSGGLLAAGAEVARQGARGGTRFPSDPEFNPAHFDGVTGLPIGDIGQTPLTENVGGQSLIGSHPDAAPARRALGNNPNPEADAAAKKAAEHQAQVNQFIASLKAEVAGLQLESDAFGKSAEAQQEAAVQKELNNTLADKGIALGSAEAKVIEEQIRLKSQATNDKASAEFVKTLEDETRAQEHALSVENESTAARVRDTYVYEKLNQLKEQHVKITDKLIAKINEEGEAAGRDAQLQERMDKARQGFEEVGGAISNAFEDAIVNGGKLSDVLKGLEQDLLRIALRQLIEQPLITALGGVGSSLFGGAHADGSPLPAGKFSLVGEQGPELVFPTTSHGMLDARSTAGLFNADRASAHAAAQPVAVRQETNVTILPPDGHTASSQKRQNSSGGMDIAVLIEQITDAQTAATLRGRGFSKLFQAMGQTRGGMSG